MTTLGVPVRNVVDKFMKPSNDCMIFPIKKKKPDGLCLTIGTNHKTIESESIVGWKNLTLIGMKRVTQYFLMNRKEVLLEGKNDGKYRIVIKYTSDPFLFCTPGLCNLTELFIYLICDRINTINVKVTPYVFKDDDDVWDVANIINEFPLYTKTKNGDVLTYRNGDIFISGEMPRFMLKEYSHPDNTLQLWGNNIHFIDHNILVEQYDCFDIDYDKSFCDMTLRCEKTKQTKLKDYLKIKGIYVRDFKVRQRYLNMIE